MWTRRDRHLEGVREVRGRGEGLSVSSGGPYSLQYTETWGVKKQRQKLKGQAKEC